MMDNKLYPELQDRLDGSLDDFNKLLENSNKKIVRRVIVDDISNSIDGDILKVIRNLQTYCYKYENEYSNIRIELTSFEGDAFAEAQLDGERLETDVEFLERIIYKFNRHIGNIKYKKELIKNLTKELSDLENV